MALSLSFSAVQSYLSCPKKYYFRYIEKHPSRPHGSMSFGSSIHNTLYRFLEPLLSHHDTQTSLLMEQSDLSLSHLLALFDKSWIRIGYDSPKVMYQRKVEGIKLLTSWYEKYAPTFGNPFVLETSFRCTIGEAEISGRYDRIDLDPDGSLHIIDYKTGKLRSQESVDQDMQLSMYMLAAEEQFKKPIGNLSLYFFEHDTWVHTKREQIQIAEIITLLEKTSHDIAQKEYTPTPSFDTCKYCDYISLCDEAIRV